ncbi:TPA: DEAD/DEAH box helicase, partial [Candidatus Poribacteria bacterium]|nr:DEAD/DEAH box helicase [Candidatus Poribacteria bacterium]
MAERDFQRQATGKLSGKKSVVIIAPTGLGKTRAALLPFMGKTNEEMILNTRLIYSLPLRALAKGVIDECISLCPNSRPIAHHGDEPESKFFSERIIVTTVDQYFTAFAGAPLSWASHLSHAA